MENNIFGEWVGGGGWEMSALFRNSEEMEEYFEQMQDLIQCQQ